MELTEFTLEQMHSVVVAHESLSAAAKALGVVPLTLGAHLGRYTHNEAPLSFDRLKAYPLEEGPQVFSEFYKLKMCDINSSPRQKRAREEDQPDTEGRTAKRAKKASPFLGYQFFPDPTPQEVAFLNLRGGDSAAPAAKRQKTGAQGDILNRPY